MSENCPDIFDRLAEERYMQQADYDSIFDHAPVHSNVKKKPVQIDEVDNIDDLDADDRESLEAEIESIEADIRINEELALRQEKLKSLRAECARWESVRTQARGNKIDATRIAKVSTKIAQLLMEIKDHESWIEKNSSEYKKRQEIDRLEHEIQSIEDERTALDGKLEILTEKLRTLKPYNAESDYHNNPNFVDDEEFENLAKLIDSRRKAAIAANEYNGDPNITSRGVVIKNPKRPALERF